MNLSEIDVSICCLVYNHEKYLRQCLDGFMMQEGVSFEILIHDDASTDHSADIIREYEKKYPNIIKPIYQTENQYSKGVKISVTFQYPRAKGKYIAICEGDDFWTDPLKLKKQVKALENHPNCSACYHYAQVVSEDGTKTNRRIPEMKITDGVIYTRNFYDILQKTAYPFQTSCYFFRSEVIKSYYQNLPLFAKNSDVGDVPLLLYSSTLGDCYFIPDTMSCRRKNSINSWNMRTYKDNNKAIAHFLKEIIMYETFEEYIKYSYFFDNIITNDRIHICVFMKNYKMANQMLRNRRKCISLRSQLSIWIHAYFPGIAHMLKRKLHSEQ